MEKLLLLYNVFFHLKTTKMLKVNLDWSKNIHIKVNSYLRLKHTNVIKITSQYMTYIIYILAHLSKVKNRKLKLQEVHIILFIMISENVLMTPGELFHLLYHVLLDAFLSFLPTQGIQSLESYSQLCIAQEQ